MSQFLKVFLLIFAVKIVFGILVPMSTDEAYYWFWGQHPQLSYFDHPAMVSWLFFLGSKLDALFSQAGLQFSRVPSIALAHASIYFWYLIFKEYLSEKKLGLLLFFILLSPLWGVGSIIVTPDAPLVFFWSLSIYLLTQISKICENTQVDKSVSNSKLLFYYGLMGASLGLGFCSKYHIILFVPAAFLYVIAEKKWFLLRPLGIIVCILSGLVFSSPVLIWNYQNDFISFKFQLQHGLATNNSWQIRWPVEYVLGQFLLIFPPVFWAAIKKPKEMNLKILYYFGWFPILFFLLTSIKSKVEANWPIAAYPALTCLGFYALQNAKSLKVTMVVWATAWLLVIGQILVPWVPIDEREIKTYELKKYNSLSAFYQKALSENSENFYASSYQMASMISYRTRFTLPLIYKAIGMSRIDYFDFQAESTPKNKRFYILNETLQPLSKELLDLGYREVSSTPIDGTFRLVLAGKE